MLHSKPNIFLSNDLQVLTARLAHTLQAEPLPPLQSEIIVVQSQGMRRWLNLELARHLGCAAHFRMPFPGTFCYELADSLDLRAGHSESNRILRDPSQSAFGREALRWRIHSILLSDPQAKVFQPIRGYLRNGDPRMRYQLAAQIAHRFDDYQIYRPDLLLGWEEGNTSTERLSHADWQAALWRLLCKTRAQDDQHLARRFQKLIECLDTTNTPAANLPKRVSVFGINSLPPVFIQLLNTLSIHTEVSLYLVIPATNTSVPEEDETAEDEPKEHKRSSKTKSKSAKAKATRAPERRLEQVRFRPAPEDVLSRCTPSDRGHPVYQSMGKQVRELLTLLRDSEGDANRFQTLDFIDPAHTSALEILHSDILNGINRGSDPRHAPLAVLPTDQSLRIHACHSPMREMEVLRDQLLAAFEDLPELRPHDILVMVPEIEKYAPFIQAVFGIQHEHTPDLRFHIADRNPTREQPLAQAVLHFLGLIEGRLAGPDILALLETPAVRKTAGISELDMAVVRHWIDQTNIRWGVDGPQRAQTYGLPDLEANSWRAGMERLLMGYCMGASEDLIAGVFPHGESTTSRADLLGRFSDWLERVFRMVEELRKPRTLEAWTLTLNDLLTGFFSSGREEDEQILRRVRDQLTPLGEIAREHGLNDEIDSAVIREHLSTALAQDSTGTGFLSGGITFCALKPMRTIPFKVIVVAGLNDADFPRKDRPPSFDLQSALPRAGDRHIQEDDRQLFLEILLAARKRLILSFVGRSQKDNRERAPSIVISELLDYLDHACRVHHKERVREHFLLEHKLQPFSNAYFDHHDSDLFSFSIANCSASARAGGKRIQDRPFIEDPLPDPAPNPVIELRELIDCWLNPSQHFCESNLNLRLSRDTEALQEAEPFLLDGLNKYILEDWLVDRRLKDSPDRDRENAVLAAQGVMPPAGLGRAWYARLETDLAPFIEQVGRPEFQEPIAVRIADKAWTLIGRIDGITKMELLRYRPAKIKPKDRLRAWIYHLALNVHAQESQEAVPTRTTVIGKDQVLTLLPIDRARSILDTLVAGYLACRKEPIPVFENASFAFANQKWKLKDPKSRSRKDPMEVALAGWIGSQQFGGNAAPGDRDNPYVALCFRGKDPLAEGATREFERWAEELWMPIFASMEES